MLWKGKPCQLASNVCGSLWVPRLLPTVNLTAVLTEILLKLALNPNEQMDIGLNKTFNNIFSH